MGFKEGKPTKKDMVNFLEDLGFNVVFSGENTEGMKNNSKVNLEQESGYTKEEIKESILEGDFVSALNKVESNFKQAVREKQEQEERNIFKQDEDLTEKTNEPEVQEVFKTIEDSINKGIAPNDLVELGFITLEDLNNYFNYLAYFKAETLSRVEEIKESDEVIKEALKTYEDVGGVDREDFSHIDFGNDIDDDEENFTTYHVEHTGNIPESLRKILRQFEEDNSPCGDCGCFDEESESEHDFGYGEDLFEGEGNYDSEDGCSCSNCYEQEVDEELLHVEFDDGYLTVNINIAGITESILDVVSEVIEDITNTQNESEEYQDTSERCECGGLPKEKCDCDEVDGRDDESNQRRHSTSFKYVDGLSDREGLIKAIEEMINETLK